MNDLRDVQRIVVEYYAQTGAWMENVAKAQVLPPDAVWRQAERQLSKGLVKLGELKLSHEDRRGFRLLREGFETMIRACEAGQKGRYQKAEQLVEKSGELLSRYLKAVTT
ncbi:hypothetical protein BABA_17392 [Neobacillus bataviensis LMG 21833]|uniref:Uncharacterized protein n=1 Tax=Neobacillus bataviensis LMG 21833 TaxID=1117379 RepID=K6C4K3_9BACI|nr:hypothetical protein [Neobacillus bataviensis]EKN66040.1 hypothetical protein BABA_17392 [Neobacillus bataviensis LMG 21833]